MTTGKGSIIGNNPVTRVMVVAEEKSPKGKLLAMPTFMFRDRVLGVPFHRSLQGDAVWNFRLRYQKFRLGDAHGAKGEVTEVMGGNDDLVAMPTGNFVTLPTAIFELKEGEWDDEDQWEDSASIEMQKLIQQISKFRASYRCFRRGGPRGSHREISDLTKDLTKEHLRLLPVSQLRSLNNRLDELKCAAEKSTDLGFRPSFLHVHFGAGKLGLGLICTALVQSALPFVIVDAPMEFWSPLLLNEERSIEIRVNDELVTTLRVVRSLDDLREVLKELKDGRHSASSLNPWKENCLIISDDAEMLTLVTEASTTFSTSVGPGLPFIAATLKASKIAHPDMPRPTMYGCENDHKAVERLGEELEGLVDVVTCMVDRICTDRELVDGKKIEISTEADPGNIVVLTPSKLPMYRPSFGGENLSIPSTSTEAHYLSNRKITIVNGMHTTLAFMTLCLQNPEHELQTHTLLTSATLPEKEQAAVWLWAVGRVLMLTWQHDIDVIKHAHGLASDVEVVDSLLNFARRALKRFTCIEDTTRRVLGGGIANRWKTRLKTQDEFLSSTAISQIPLGTLCLTRANVIEADLREAVKKLCDESYRFTNLSSVTNLP